MGHTAPDWSWGKSTTVYDVWKGLAELAVRQSSIVSFDRRGNVVFMDGFEDGFAPYFTEVSGGLSAVELSVHTSRNGAQSASLTSEGAWPDYGRVTRHQGPFVPSKLGFEASFALPRSVGIYMVYVEVFDGAQQVIYGWRYDAAAAILEVYNVPVLLPVWTVVGALDLWNFHHLFHTTKLVVDLATDKYVRLMIDSLEFDLSSYTPYSVGDFTNSRLRWDNFYSGRAAAVDVLYLDDLIMTQNEE